ncbi:MAG: GspE/PulE family protein [bacterium]
MYTSAALYNSLKSLAFLDAKKLEECYSIAQEKSKDLHEVLLDYDLISDDNLGKLKADLYNLPYIRLSENDLNKDTAKIIPEVFAKRYLCLVCGGDVVKPIIACVNPENEEMLSLLSTRFGKNYSLVYATPRDIHRAFRIYSEDAQVVFSRLINSSVSEASTAKLDPPIITIIDTILRFAYERLASDIHIEPQQDSTLVRFRIDGVMYDIVSLPSAIHPRLVSRIKVMSELRTDENQSSQDGKFTFNEGSERIDVRVSLIPVVDGENIVMRLLSEQSRQFSLLDLGLIGDDAHKVDAARAKPHGMVLVTGPTGSGKTTTLYALLKLLNSRGVNIMTIEDPVEYGIEGISQIQVNSATNLTFADGLRSIVRQDPDIILVGEIRDNETAGIAVNAAMTGHLVLTTLHTNDAATAIPRLLDMGVEPFLVSSTVNIIIAQRLVRKICNRCKTSVETNVKDLAPMLSLEIIKKHFGTGKIRLYQGEGCAACKNLGYKGRIGIFEVMVLSDQLKAAIVSKQDAGIIQNLATKEGMNTMLEDGLNKVKNGVTTLAEVLRVTKE